MQDGPLQRYRQMVQARELAPDIAQELAAEKLQLLANRLAHYSEPRRGVLLPFARRRRTAPEGLYLYGGVGRGKTMLLDLFFDSVHYAPKRRVHFQEFMAEAHEAIERGRKAAADPIGSAAAEIGNDAALLCFDEFEVTDIADAMILGRLFQHLFASNVVIVATSNTAPRDLYRDGLNRQLFTPFIKLIEERMEVYQLESAKDYRLEKLQGSDLYLTPADARAGAAMDASFRKLTGRIRGEPQTLNHKGRSITVPEAALGVARFTFADLCGAPLGSLDYQRIAHRLSYADDRGDSGARAGAAERSAPAHDPDRRALRQWRWADRLRRGGAARALCGWHRGRELRPHRLAAHGDALGGLSRGAASAERSRCRARLKATPHALARCRKCQ